MKPYRTEAGQHLWYVAAARHPPTPQDRYYAAQVAVRHDRRADVWLAVEGRSEEERVHVIDQHEEPRLLDDEWEARTLAALMAARELLQEADEASRYAASAVRTAIGMLTRRREETDR